MNDEDGRLVQKQDRWRVLRPRLSVEDACYQAPFGRLESYILRLVPRSAGDTVSVGVVERLARHPGVDRLAEDADLHARPDVQQYDG